MRRTDSGRSGSMGHGDLKYTDKKNDSGVSEVISAMLMVFLVIAAALVAWTYIFGSVDETYLQEPAFAYFSTEVIEVHESGGQNVPVIRMYQAHGDELEQRYEENSHSGIEGMKIMLYDPNGDGHEVVTANSMRGDTVEIAENFYIFYYYLNPSEANYWITNDPKRVFGPGNPIDPFPVHGTWRMIITEEDSQNTIVADIPLSL